MPLASAIDFLLLAAIWGSSFLFMRLAVVDLGPLPLTGLPPLVTACGSQVGATLGLALAAALLWPARAPGTQAWLAVLALGIVCTGLAYILYFRLIEQAGPARAVTVTYAVPVFAIVYGALFLGERVTPWMVGCGAVVVLGTALSSGLLRWPAARRRPT